jgi:hypothetical protein
MQKFECYRPELHAGGTKTGGPTEAAQTRPIQNQGGGWF